MRFEIDEKKIGETITKMRELGFNRSLIDLVLEMLMITEEERITIEEIVQVLAPIRSEF